MSIKRLLTLSIVLGIFSTLLEEGLFYCNFTCIRMSLFLENITSKYIYQFGLSCMIQISSLFIIGGLYSLFPHQNDRLRGLLVICTILFLVINTFLKFYTPLFHELGLLGEVSLFTWIIFVFYTFFYSILYLKRKEKKE